MSVLVLTLDYRFTFLILCRWSSTTWSWVPPTSSPATGGWRKTKTMDSSAGSSTAGGTLDLKVRQKLCPLCPCFNLIPEQPHLFCKHLMKVIRCWYLLVLFALSLIHHLTPVSSALSLECDLWRQVSFCPSQRIKLVDIGTMSSKYF